ncbi:MAG: BatD family protein [Oligoflexia bacterium]|nr:BatD family protein [Oligoflexia bacterium]MBF0366848.1 BatD family protein [Oligoflexia bacterium]
MSRFYYSLVLMLVCLFLSLGVLASDGVKLKAEVNKALLKVSDELIFKITLKAPLGITPKMPEIGNEIAGLRIIEFGEEKPKEEDLEVTYQKWYKLTSDISGSYILPPLEVKYHDPKSGSEKSAKTAEIFLEVQSDAPAAEGTAAAATPTAKEELRDIKDIEDIPVAWGSKHFALLGILLLIALLAGYTLWVKYYKKERSASLPPIPPHERAIKLLSELQAKDYLQRDDFKNYYFSLSAIVREYLENQFHYPATDMTLEEIKASFDRCTVAAQEKEVALLLFEHCDVVKFTDHTPNRDICLDHLKMAFDFVEATKPTPIMSAVSETKVSSGSEESVV